MYKIIFVTGTIRGKTAWPYLFAKGLSDCGIDVTVISGFANIDVSEEYREHQLANPSEVISPLFRIIRVGSKKRDPHSIAKRGLKYIKLTNDLCHELKKYKADCILFYSTPPFLGLVGKKYAKNGHKTIYIAQDLFPDSLFSIKPRIEKSIIGKILRKMERNIYDGNSKIITISETMAERIKSNMSSRDGIRVIYNWADIDKLKNIERDCNRLFDEYGIDRTKFIVSYAGSLGPLQNINVLLDVAKELLDYSNIEFVIFGRGICRDDLNKRIENEHIYNVKLLPIQPPEKISNAYSLGDIEYVSVSPGVMKMACPHKIYDIFSVGNPVLAAIDSNCDMAATIVEKKMGYVVKAEKKSIKMAILEAYNQDENELRKMGLNARAFAESIDYYSQIKKYIKVITE